MKKHRKIIVCGEKAIAENCLEFLLRREDTSIVGIVAAETDWQADLIGWARRHDIAVLVGNINRYQAELSSLRPDFLFSIQYRPLIKEMVLQIPTHGCFNLHFGLLPRYGGCYPVAWAILNGEERAGVTLHRMSPRFDEGDIVIQQAVRVGQTTTARGLFDSLTEAGTELFKSVYPDLVAGNIVAVPQDISQQLYYSKDSIDFVHDSLLDWDKPGLEIQRRICAFSFEPFQLPTTGIRIGEVNQTVATVSETKVEFRPCGGSSTGEIVAANHDGTISVKCADESLIRIAKLDGQDPLGFLTALSAPLKEVRFVRACPTLMRSEPR